MSTFAKPQLLVQTGAPVERALGGQPAKKVLIVAYYFPPVAAIGGMRPLAFARFLDSFGWSARVMTTKSVYPYLPSDPQLSAKIPAYVRVDYVAHDIAIQRLVRWWNRIKSLLFPGNGASSSRPKGNSETNGRALPSEPGRSSKFKNVVLDSLFAFPDLQCDWQKPAIAHAKAWPKEEVPDVVLATGGPWTNFLVGQALAEHWGVPFIADYRDPWTSNPFDVYSTGYLHRKAVKVERSVCESAAAVITNAKELRLRIEKDYPAVRGKSLTITNGFDPDSFSPNAPTPTTGATASRQKKLELCHFGTVYNKRTPVVLLEALLELYKAGRVNATQLSLRFVGHWMVIDTRCLEVAEALEKADLLKREPPVPYEACLRQMTNADALLVIQPDSPLQIPGKIYEYIATRRPIILIGGEGATANLVYRHRFGHPCRNNMRDLCDVLAGLVDGSLDLRSPSTEDVNRFDYRTLTGELARVLDSVTRVRASARS